MRKVLMVLAFAPALARAQDARGPCPGSVGLDSVLQGYVTKPDRKPHRQADGVEPVLDDGGGYMLATARNAGPTVTNGGASKFVRFVGVVDTTGRLDSTSVTIMESPSPVLSAAVCAAAREMRFDPAMRGGRKVPALYKDWFSFLVRYDITRMGRQGPER
jgi:hypothetical protein